jgi:hypothetical protein
MQAERKAKNMRFWANWYGLRVDSFRLMLYNFAIGGDSPSTLTRAAS